MELFEQCRERLWRLFQKLDQNGGFEYCKSYEGAIDVTTSYDNYFSSPDSPPPIDFVEIILHCYVLGNGRHHHFRGRTLEEAAWDFSEWLDHEEELHSGSRK